MRFAISAAAALVNVRQRLDSGRAPLSSSTSSGTSSCTCNNCTSVSATSAAPPTHSRWHRTAAIHVLRDGAHCLRWHTTRYEIHEEPWRHPPVPVPAPGAEVVVWFHSRHPEQWRLSTPHRPVWVLAVLGAGLVLHHQNANRHYDRFRNRLILPVCDGNGRPIAFGARLVDAEPSTAAALVPMLASVFEKGKDGGTEKIGIDDYLSKHGNWASLVAQIAPAMPPRPTDDIIEWVAEQPWVLRTGKDMRQAAHRLQQAGAVADQDRRRDASRSRAVAAHAPRQHLARPADTSADLEDARPQLEVARRRRLGRRAVREIRRQDRRRQEVVERGARPVVADDPRPLADDEPLDLRPGRSIRLKMWRGRLPSRTQRARWSSASSTATPPRAPARRR